MLVWIASLSDRLPGNVLGAFCLRRIRPHFSTGANSEGVVIYYCGQIFSFKCIQRVSSSFNSHRYPSRSTVVQLASCRGCKKTTKPPQVRRKSPGKRVGRLLLPRKGGGGIFAAMFANISLEVFDFSILHCKLSPNPCPGEV